MPPEPKKPIEELLEASAKARRAQFGSDPQMPNPMRAQLHDEIARLTGREEPETRKPWLRIWWPRLIIGAAAAALVIGAPLMWWRTQQPAGESTQLATNQPVVRDESNRLAAKSSGSLADTHKETKALGLTAASEKDAPPLKKFADVAIASPPATPIAEEVPAVGKESARLSAGKPAAAAFAPREKMEATNLKQQFSQKLARQAFQSEKRANQAANILRTFQIEQKGAQIRMVDADGSTYTGKIEPIPEEKQKDDRVAKRAATLATQDVAPAGTQFYFRAAGYNSSLKKSLVFEGKYIPTLAAQQNAGDLARANGQEPMPARIRGTARIPGESPVVVDALSVGP